MILAKNTIPMENNKTKDPAIEEFCMTKWRDNFENVFQQKAHAQ